MEYTPLRAGTTSKGILRFYFAPKLDTLLLNSLMGLFIMFMLLEDEEDYVGVGVMDGWEKVAFDAERAQLISLLSGIAGHAPQPRFKAIFPSLKELIIAFDYTSSGKTRFRTSVWPGENGTTLTELSLPSATEGSSDASSSESASEHLETIEDARPHWTTQAAAHIFAPMKQYLQNDYGEPNNVAVEIGDEIASEIGAGLGGQEEEMGGDGRVPVMKIAKVKRKKYIRGDIRYVFRKTCSVFGVRPRGVFRRL